MNYNTILNFLQDKKIRKILVTGPQRSGTRIATHILAQDLNFECLDEMVYGIHDYRIFQDLVKNRINFVAQGPALCYKLEILAKEIFIIYMIRDVSAIIKSQKRIKWAYEEIEKNIFKMHFDKILTYPSSCYRNIKNMDWSRPISELKYYIWDNIQKKNIQNYLELDYESLKGHQLWVDDRKSFKNDQIKP